VVQASRAISKTRGRSARSSPSCSPRRPAGRPLAPMSSWSWPFAERATGTRAASSSRRIQVVARPGGELHLIDAGVEDVVILRRSQD
jgi:hypothetical protein